MDAGSGIARIQESFFASLEELKKKEINLADLESQLKLGQQKLDEDKDRLAEERKKIVQREEDLNKEKEMMAKYPADESDIIELNVQGNLIQTHRSTLTQFRDTYLSGLFNGCWESKIRRDAEGRVFLDFIPTIFRYLLDYLTDRKLSKSSPHTSLPRVPECHFAQFRLLIQHLGIEEAIYGSPKCFSRSLKSNTIFLGSDGMAATSTSDVMGYVLGEGVYQNEAIEFSLKAKTLQQPWIFVGIMEDSNERVKDNSFNGNPGAFGWAGLGGVWAAGEKLLGAPIIPEKHLTSGLQMNLLLVCYEDQDAYLSLNVESDGLEYKIEPLPQGRRWRLHVNMVGIDDTIELLGVTQLNNDFAPPSTPKRLMVSN